MEISNDEKKTGLSKDINLFDLVDIIWRAKYRIVLASCLVTVITLFIVLRLPNIYRAEVLLVPAEEISGGGLSNIASQIGGLASLAGVKVGQGAGVDKFKLAIEVMKSRVFLTSLIQKYDLLVPLMAATGWDRNTGKLIIDEEIYDEEKKDWVREVSAPYLPKPTLMEAYSVFKERVISIDNDLNTGLITVAVNFYSPLMAKEWAEYIVAEANEYMRSREISETKRSIDFLKLQAENTDVAQMQSVFYGVIEEQIKKNMLAQTREEFVFKVVDPAVEPLEKTKPDRLLLLALSLVLSVAVFSAISVVMAMYKTRSRA